MSSGSTRERAKRALGETALRVADRANGRLHIPLDYPTSADNSPRWGHGRPPNPHLAALIEAGDDRYRRHLESFLAHADALAAIPRQPAGTEPGWINGWLPGLDAAAIYCFLRELRPTLYLEVGSGNSTTFARRAISDGELGTRLVSIDPQPRAEIDVLCDEMVRKPLESADRAPFEQLQPGDVLFFDGSHRAFMNSDAVAFFLEVYPSLPAGVLVGVHDIYLPDDYPADIADRYYSEQYLLAAMLLGGERAGEIELPAHHCSRSQALASALEPLWSRRELSGVERHGVAFWLRTGEPVAA
jgi:hypothetical protein